MIANLLILAAGIGFGALVQHRRDRHAVEDHRARADMADYFRDAADRLAVEVDEARHAVTTLRAIVADQAVIVRRALGRPQKRRVAAGAS